MLKCFNHFHITISLLAILEVPNSWATISKDGVHLLSFTSNLTTEFNITGEISLVFRLLGELAHQNHYLHNSTALPLTHLQAMRLVQKGQFLQLYVSVKHYLLCLNKLTSCKTKHCLRKMQIMHPVLHST